MHQTIQRGANTIRCNRERCYGCRTCELACSFHHSGAFSPERSSIRAMKNNQTGVITWHVDESCDLCEGEGRIFCIQYCAYKALKVGVEP
jgi:carbon-monoxide dehydrogenase iron sulfur subunit